MRAAASAHPEATAQHVMTLARSTCLGLADAMKLLQAAVLRADRPVPQAPTTMPTGMSVSHAAGTALTVTTTLTATLVHLASP